MSIVVQDIQDQIQTIKKQKQEQKDNRDAKKDELEASINLLDNFKKNRDSNNFERERKNSKLTVNLKESKEESKNDDFDMKKFEIKKLSRDNIETDSRRETTNPNAKYEKFINELDSKNEKDTKQLPSQSSNLFENSINNDLKREINKKPVKSFLTKAEEKSNNLEQRKNEKKTQLIEMLNHDTNKFNYKPGLSNDHMNDYYSNNSATKIRNQIHSLMNTFEIGSMTKDKKNEKSKLIQKIEEKNYNTLDNYTQKSKVVKLTDPMSLINNSKPLVNRNSVGIFDKEKKDKSVDFFNYDNTDKYKERNKE